MVDLGSGRLAGWQIADHMRAGLVEDALRAAARDRGSLAGALFHGGHGSVDTSRAHAVLCGQLTVTRSMSGVGTSADTSLAGRFNAALKGELLEDRAVLRDRATAYRAVLWWANRYNTRRRHSAVGHVSPTTYEAAYAATASAAIAEAAQPNRHRVHDQGSRLAQLERATIRERQAEGIALAKQRGVCNRPPKLSPDQIDTARQRNAGGVPKTVIARDLNISRQTLYTALAGQGR